MITITLGMALTATGCRQYPEATHPDTIRFIAAVRTACSSRQPEWLDQCEQAIQSSFEAGHLTDREHTALCGIIDMARQGDWEKAEKACYRFQQDQVRR